MSEHSKIHVNLPYQAEFIEAFVRSSLPAYHLLVAPPGTGKTHAACAIVERLVTMGQALHVLVLAPAALRAQWASRLESAGVKVPALAVDRQVFRELQASVPVGQLPWSKAPFVVLSLELLHHADVYEAVVGQYWDLVIVDECHRIKVVADQRQGKKFDGTAILRQLIDENRVQRLLLMTATPGERGSYVPGLAVTQWQLSLPSFRGIELLYEPDTDEQNFLQALDRFLQAELIGQTARSIRQVILAQAESSIFCLEPQLLYWMEKLERSASQMEVAGRSDLADDGVESDQPAGLAWRDPAASVAGLRSLLQMLDKVQSDAKLQALLRVVQEQREAHDGQANACVVTKMNKTAWYLHSALQNAGENSLRLQRDLNPDEVRSTIERFRSHGGVLVAVPSSLQGVELPEVHTVISYDHLTSPTMELVLGRFNRIGRSRPLTVFVMRRREQGVVST